MKNYNYFPTIVHKVKTSFPELEDKQIKYISNCITNKIRRGHFDCYGIDVDSSPIERDGGCYLYHTIDSCGTIIYVCFTVD